MLSIDSFSGNNKNKCCEWILTHSLLNSWTNQTNSERIKDVNDSDRNLKNTTANTLISVSCAVVWWCVHQCALCVVRVDQLCWCVYILYVCDTDTWVQLSSVTYGWPASLSLSRSLTVSRAFELPLSVSLLFELVSVEANVFSFCQHVWFLSSFLSLSIYSAFTFFPCSCRFVSWGFGSE